MVVRFYSSVAPETTLSAGITGASTSIQVGSVTGFPANTPYTLALDYEGIAEELVQVNSAAGTTLTVTRAVDGTSAASHNAGARVRHVSSARDFADSRTHENSDQGIHGLAPSDTLVGEDAVQTLTNKTLQSPGIIGGLLTGTSWSGAFSGGALDTFRSINQVDVTLASTGHAVQIGPTAGANLRMDNNEIMAVSNGATSTLSIQADGGPLSVFGAVAANSTANIMGVNGSLQPTNVITARPTNSDITFSSRQTGDANARFLTRADGQIRWSDGTLSTDTGLSRSAAGVVTVDNSLATTGLTATNSTIQNLTVTNTFNPPQTTASGATVGAAGADWNIVTLVGMKVGGTTFVTGVVNRTGPTITPVTTSPDAGNITDTTMVTLTPAWRSNAGYNVTIACPVTDGIGDGGARLNTDGTLDLVSWTPNNLIQSGGGDNVRFSISFPSA